MKEILTKDISFILQIFNKAISLIVVFHDRGDAASPWILRTLMYHLIKHNDHK